MQAKKILVTDDDVAVVTSLKLLFKQAGYRVFSALEPDSAKEILEETDVDAVILDMNFSRSTDGQEGLLFLKDIKQSYPEIPVVLITAWGSIQLAVEGMKAGASDFITKPWNNKCLVDTIKLAISLAEKRTLSPAGRRQLEKNLKIDNIVGQSPKLIEVLNTVGRICRTDAPVLICGESGTGKELIAEAIHKNSHRKNNPFVKVNLGGISSSLFESEMFGHVKGAFTDAGSNRVGRFELADQGTIFLDEIGDLDLNSQVKLLRVLQDRQFEVLGSSKTKSANVRIISATNRKLKEMVENKEFREDLFYRINLIPINLPSLRERSSDIPLLINYFVNNLKRMYKRESIVVNPSAVEWLQSLPWPGNIRELRNLVERTILVTTNDILEVSDFNNQYDSLPGNKESKNLPSVGSMTLEEMEESMIRKTLKSHGSNISKVAALLGLSRSALYRRMEKYGIKG